VLSAHHAARQGTVHLPAPKAPLHLHRGQRAHGVRGTDVIWASLTDADVAHLYAPVGHQSRWCCLGSQHRAGVSYGMTVPYHMGIAAYGKCLHTRTFDPCHSTAHTHCGRTLPSSTRAFISRNVSVTGVLGSTLAWSRQWGKNGTARHLLQCMMTQIAAATLEGAAQWCHPHMASTSSLLCLPVQVEEVDVVCAKTAQAGLTGSTHMRAAAIKDQS
jgi:hypothetical protein